MKTNRCTIRQGYERIKHILILAGIIAIQVSTQVIAGPPWVKYTLSSYPYIMMGIDFPAGQSTIGYMVGESLTYNGNGIVLKTTDGGNTWNQMWTGVNKGVEGASFPTLTTGYIAGWPHAATGWSGCGKSTDGGATWSSLSVIPDVYYFTDVIFKDENNGILLGATNSSPVVMVTSNGGSSWSMATGASQGIPMSGCHVSGSTYFLVDNGGRIKKSIDNGLNWTTVYTIPGGLLTGIDFLDNNTGMACGDYGVIAKTTDGGVTWTVQQVGSDIWRDFGWENPGHVFCSGTPEIVAESINGGSTWFNGFPASTYQNALYECVFTADGHGFICGSQGTLLKRLPSCTAGFSSNNQSACKGQTISFTSQCYGNISTWEWYFEGGSPTTSNQPDPVVIYNTPGTYDVRLIVNNGYWSDTLTRTDYITVSYTEAPVISASGWLLTSNIASGNQWYRNGFMIAGANQQTYQAVDAGRYWDVVTQNGCPSDTSNNIFIVVPGMGKTDEDGLTMNLQNLAGTPVLRISGLSAGKASCMLYGADGRLVVNRQSESETASFPWEIRLSSLLPGIYLIVVQDSKTRVTRKFCLSD